MEIEKLVEKQRAFFATGVTRDVPWRISQLKAFEAGLKKWEKPLCEALWADLHKSYEEAYMTEIGLVYGELREALRKTARWARRRRVPTPVPCLPSRGFNVPAVSKVLAEFVADTFPEEYVAVVPGGRDVNAELFRHRYDLVFLTGSPLLARVLMEAQAQYLTPVVLELGGKSPCIVDRDADLRIAARRIAWGKSLNGGQTCIAPDYLFLHEDIREAFIEAFRTELAGLYPGGTEESTHYVHVVHDAAFDRLTAYLKDGEILVGGRYNRETRWMEPTLLGGVSPDAPVMTEEIFGPVFPVLPFRDRAEVAAFVNGREKPLAFYYFGKPEAGWELIGQTSSGGACINDVIMHIANRNLPFGGVGNSGMGSYHSERSFLAFTHEKSVVRTPVWPDPPFRYMPYRLFRLVKKLL